MGRYRVPVTRGERRGVLIAFGCICLLMGIILLVVGRNEEGMGMNAQAVYAMSEPGLEQVRPENGWSDLIRADIRTKICVTGDRFTFEARTFGLFSPYGGIPFENSVLLYPYK